MYKSEESQEAPKQDGHAARRPLWCVACTIGTKPMDFLLLCDKILNMDMEIQEISFHPNSIPFIVIPLGYPDDYDRIRTIQKIENVGDVFPHKGRQDCSL